MNDAARTMLVDALVNTLTKSCDAEVTRRAEVIASVGEQRGETYATTFDLVSPFGTHRFTIEEREGSDDVSS